MLTAGQAQLLKLIGEKMIGVPGLAEGVVRFCDAGGGGCE